MGTPETEQPFTNIQTAGERDVSPPPMYGEHTHYDTTSIQPRGPGVSALDSMPKDAPPPYSGSDGDTMTSAYAEQELQPVMTYQPQSYQRNAQTSAGISSSTQPQGYCANCNNFCNHCPCWCLCLCCQISAICDVCTL
ncbi:uncharacterized protein [Littorina saxatilis]|uniref:Uncharacterized protein n=1 Tax=Littorina saxatilis TaxID=31220 RepID=A0AAN9BC44_9CAEN